MTQNFFYHGHLGFNFALIFTLLFLLLFVFGFFLEIDLSELRSVRDVIVVSFAYDFATSHDYDFIGFRGEFDGMGRHDNSFALKKLSNGLFYYELAHVHIYCTQNIV